MVKNKNTDWFKDAKYGVFFHYLCGVQNNAKQENGLSMGKQTSWDECVNEFDVEKFAKDVAETGATYVMFTFLQCTQYMIAPNETYNKYSGYKTGEACSTRDLMDELITALDKYDIKMMPYFTADGPHHDPQTKKAFNLECIDKTETCPQFMKKWFEVAREFSLRYGERIHGWWIDGSHLIGYNDETLGEFADNLRAGNEKSIVAFNPGNADIDVRYWSGADDYVPGERNKLYGQTPPEQRWINDRQWHCLAPLGDHWGCPNVCYTPDEIITQLKDVGEKEGVITFDIAVYRDGSLSKEQIELLKEVKKAIRK